MSMTYTVKTVNGISTLYRYDEPANHGTGPHEPGTCFNSEAEFWWELEECWDLLKDVLQLERSSDQPNLQLIKKIEERLENDPRWKKG